MPELLRRNVRLACSRWPQLLDRNARQLLKTLTKRVSVFSCGRRSVASCPPNRFIQGPVNADTGFSEERIQE
jgi:hypothetical protein